MAFSLNSYHKRFKTFREGFLETESRALFYWSAVLYGLGIAVYFSLSFEPPLWPALIGIGILFGFQALAKGRPFVTLNCRALMIVLAGFSVATIRTTLIDHQPLARETGPVVLEGRIDLVEDRIEGGLRLSLDHVSYEGGSGLPGKIRITVRTGAPDLYPGMVVRTRAILLPLPEPVLPGGYDFARGLWFDGFGAVGFAIDDVMVVDAPPATFRQKVDGLRQTLAERITKAAPGPGGAIAAALLTGMRDKIPEEVSENMRIAGLAHLLAISGLHMALVTGVLYLVLRTLFALIPRIALRYPVRKFAAFGALLGALGYLIISGGGLSTQRAFIMVCVVLLAIMTDRKPISMRLVAIAAIAVLTLSPEALLSPSFQMSFAAVTGLVAGYGWLGPKFTALKVANPGIFGRARLYVLGVLISTLIAEVTIGPIALYHFGRFATYGLLANLAAVPLMGLVVMPAGLLGLALVPVGLDGPVWRLMAAVIDWITEIAAGIAKLPHADLRLPEMPLAALTLIAITGLWMALWQGRGLKRMAVIPLAAGLAMYLTYKLPDVVIDRDGTLTAVRSEGGGYYFSSLRTASFTRDIWLRTFGQSVEKSFREFPSKGMAELGCDPLGCVYTAKGFTIALGSEPEAFDQDCSHADVVITPFYAPFSCKDEKIVIDRKAINDNGAYAVWLGNTIRIVSVGESRGKRPWTVSPQ